SGRRGSSGSALRPNGRSGVIRLGLIFGVVAVYLCLVGIVEAFKGRLVLGNMLGLGWTVLLITALGGGYTAARRRGSAGAAVLACGFVVLLTVLMLAALLLLGSMVDLRAMFVNASPGLYALLTFGHDLGGGAVLLLITEAAAGVCGALLFLMPRGVRGT